MSRLALVLVLLPAMLRVLPFFAPQTDAVVGTGTLGSCDEAAFNIALNAVQTGGGGTITFNCGGAASINFLTQKFISQPVTINGAAQIVLDGGNTTRLFYVSPGGSLSLVGLTLQKGISLNDDGGAIFVDLNGALTIDGSVIRDSNTAPSWSGGAICAYGPVTISNSLFENNTGGNGGALYPRFEAADVELWNTTFRNNRTTNTSSSWGGAILPWDGADVNIHGGVFENNSAAQGGAIHNRFANSILWIDQNSVFTGNVVTVIGSNLNPRGAAIYNISGGVTVENSSFTGNTTTRYGGAIYNGENGVMEISDSAFTANTATQGGGILNDAAMTLLRVRLSQNTAAVGAGVISYRDLVLIDVSFTANQAALDGGGLVNFNGTANLRNVTFNGNSAGNGGGFYNLGTATLNNVTISGNVAFVQGGGLWSGYALASVSMTNVTIANNISPSGSSVFFLSPAGSRFAFKNTIFSTAGGVNCAGVGAAASAGFNRASDATCSLTNVGDQVVAQMRLGPLVNNGGFTLTHLPYPGSPALNNGTGIGVQPADQRGLPRPAAGGSSDIGAVERQPGDVDTYLLFLPALLR